MKKANRNLLDHCDLTDFLQLQMNQLCPYYSNYVHLLQLIWTSFFPNIEEEMMF